MWIEVFFSCKTCLIHEQNGRNKSGDWRSLLKKKVVKSLWCLQSARRHCLGVLQMIWIHLVCWWFPPFRGLGNTSSITRHWIASFKTWGILTVHQPCRFYSIHGSSLETTFLTYAYAQMWNNRMRGTKYVRETFLVQAQSSTPIIFPDSISETSSTF